jgi:hypothetical protein
VTETVTPEQTYFRLHGVTGARHVYTDDELRRLEAMLPEQADRPYVLFNTSPRRRRRARSERCSRSAAELSPRRAGSANIRRTTIQGDSMAGFPAPQPWCALLTEGGQETELMYKHGHELPEFAMYPLPRRHRARSPTSDGHVHRLPGGGRRQPLASSR